MKLLVATGLLLPLVSSFILPPAVMERDVLRTKRDCPMSPYARYLTDEQQQALHELIVEARKNGATEETVKQHMERYIGELLPPTRFAEFKRDNEKFEQERMIVIRGKRQAERDYYAKQRPARVFDLVDYYSGDSSAGDALTKFYEETKTLRHLP